MDHDEYVGMEMFGYNSSVTAFCNRATYDIDGRPELTPHYVFSMQTITNPSYVQGIQ